MECGDPFHLLDVLSSHDVPFVVIGGHAVTCPLFAKGILAPWHDPFLADPSSQGFGD